MKLIANQPNTRFNWPLIIWQAEDVYFGFIRYDGWGDHISVACYKTITFEDGEYAIRLRDVMEEYPPLPNTDENWKRILETPEAVILEVLL